MNTASAPRTDSPSAVVNANRPCSRFERTIVCLPFLTPATISNRRRLHRYHLGLGRLSTNVMHGIMLCLCDKVLCPCDNERRRFLRISLSRTEFGRPICCQPLEWPLWYVVAILDSTF